MKRYPRLSWLLIGALLASLGANLFLARQIREFYGRRLWSQTFPAGLPAAPVVSGETNRFTITVLLYGDSRMAAWKIPPPPGMRLVNAGVNGATTAQLRLRLQPLLAEFHPDVVVVQAGINDLKLMGIQPEREADLVANAATNLLAICHDCLTNHCQVILLETWPAGPPEWLRLPVWNEHIAEAVTRLNASLAARKPASTHFSLVDLLAEAGQHPEPADYRDALHFEPEFYRRLTAQLLHQIEKSGGRE